MSSVDEALATSDALALARSSIIFCIFSIIWSCFAILSLVLFLSSSALLLSSSAILLFSSHHSFDFLFSSSHFFIISFIWVLNVASWVKHDTDDQEVGLTGSGSTPIPRTRPEYSTLPIALARASSSAYSIEPYGDTGFALAMSSVISSFIFSWHIYILNVLIIIHLFDLE